MTPDLEIQLIAVLTAVACALPGVFLVLRRMAMMSDAISHAILLGIVLAFFYTESLVSPLLLIGATLTGVLTVVLVEVLERTGRLREDAAIGLVFPILFSLGVILIAQYAGDVHLDTDAVLLGELAFAPFDRLIINGVDYGPKALTLMGGILLINVLFINLFYKELKLATFDASLAAVLGFFPVAIHYGLMALVSVTAVGAFEAVGSILVVALMIAPPITANLLTDRLSTLLLLSAGFGAISALAGYWAAHWFDVSIAGSMATMAGVCFGVVFTFAPKRGLVALARRRKRQRMIFAEKMLVIHLIQHEGLPEAIEETRADHLQHHISWTPAFAEQVVRYAQAKGTVRQEGPMLHLTETGRHLAGQAIVD